MMTQNRHRPNHLGHFAADVPFFRHPFQPASSSINELTQRKIYFYFRLIEWRLYRRLADARLCFRHQSIRQWMGLRSVPFCDVMASKAATAFAIIIQFQNIEY